MGEFSANDCTWKKMVLTKSDNEWTSTMKSEERSGGFGSDTPSFGLDHLGSFGAIKTETDEANFGQSLQNDHFGEEATNMVQELDPLMIEDPQPRRRRGSGPKAESDEERASRLAKMSAYAAQRLASETPEQRALRLKRMSAYAARRLANETPEQRALRLKRMSAYAARRLARETPEQRQLRLTRMSAYAAKRQAQKKIATGAVATSGALKSFDDSAPTN